MTHKTILFGSLSLIAATALGVSFVTAQNAPVNIKMPAGFHVAAPGEMAIKKPVTAKLHSKPVPLSAQDLKTQGAKFGIVRPIVGGGHGPFPLPQPINLTYQLEMFGNSYGVEFDTTTFQNAFLYGGDGYVQVNFNTNAGGQYLLDCSLGFDGTYKVGTAFSGPSLHQPYLSGTISSFNRHLLIPLSPTPAGAQNAAVVISFSGPNGVEFYGCQVDTVSQ